MLESQPTFKLSTSELEAVIGPPSVKLVGRKNYNEWRQAVHYHLYILEQWGHINGQTESTWHTEERKAKAAKGKEWFPPYEGPRPPSSLSEHERETKTRNRPATNKSNLGSTNMDYETWKRTDDMVLNTLLGCLSEPVFRMFMPIVGCNTNRAEPYHSRQLWDDIAEVYADTPETVYEEWMTVEPLLVKDPKQSVRFTERWFGTFFNRVYALREVGGSAGEQFEVYHLLRLLQHEKFAHDAWIENSLSVMKGVVPDSWDIRNQVIEAARINAEIAIRQIDMQL